VCRWLAPPGTVDEDSRILRSLHTKKGDQWRLVYALERLQRSLQRGLTHTAARWPPIQTAYALVFRAVQFLNNDEQVSAAEVRHRYAQVLDEMQAASANPGTDPLVKAWYTTFLKVTASYGEALFQCYDHPDLPHTNNDVEHLFGSLRYHERRASGRKQVAPMLLLRGQARVLASVSTRLRTYQVTDLPPGNLARWRSLRKTLDARQETRRQQRRFRQNPQGYLLALEERCEQMKQHPAAEGPSS